MDRAPLFSWTGKEYEHRPKTADWYWALGIIAISLSVAAVLFDNYLLAIVIVLAAGALMVHAHKEPPLHTFNITEQGLFIGDEFHPYEKMISFSLWEGDDDVSSSLLSIKTASLLSPHLVIPISGVSPQAIQSVFATHVNEEDHPPTLVDIVAGWLGF